MTGYEGSMSGADNTRKGGATNGGPAGNPSSLGSGHVPPIVGSPTPVVVKTGATNG